MTVTSLSFPSFAEGAGVSSQHDASRPFFEILSGERAFYNQENYLDVIRRDLASRDLMPISYECDIDDVQRRTVGITHSLVGRLVLPASRLSKKHIDNIRTKVLLENGWKYKRITIKVSGCEIDAVIVGSQSKFNSRRWILVSNGNGECYENQLRNNCFYELLNHLQSNAVFFNYPGVGASQGSPNKEMVVKAYRAMLTFLEDQTKGIGAKEIIGYGFSIGGVVQGEALLTHQLKEDIRYVFIKDRTFATLSSTVSTLISESLGPWVKKMGWELDPFISSVSSRMLQIPEIILQTANVDAYEKLENSSQIIDDGIISASASLGRIFLDWLHLNIPRKKVFIGIPERHNEGLRDTAFLAREIKSFLEKL